ncbi:hypothetical protein [Brachybacterium ginsengisoli]|uniref:hypothetical protein n=1 Tax=Brachybacterium ginsengisoli TaxID=1331682 RepID=UPI00157FB87C|nr:hypothetical protein [Brachybacterium ginsengisoli]
MLIGTVPNALFLAGFALYTGVPPRALVFMLGIGLVGVTMNPAMVSASSAPGLRHRWSIPSMRRSSASA